MKKLQLAQINPAFTLAEIMKLSKKVFFVLVVASALVSCKDEESDTKPIDEEPVIEYSDKPPFYPIDFEEKGFGANWTWTVFENDDNPPVEFVANPDASGINTSKTVAKITARKNGANWVGCETKHGADIGSFRFDETNKIVKVLVYKSVISDVALKFAEYAPPGVGADAQPEIKVANTKINEWEELTFDLSGSIGKGATGIIDQLILFPDFKARSSDNIIYFDNIRFGN
jgi:hypothetical protein